MRFLGLIRYIVGSSLRVRVSDFQIKGKHLLPVNFGTGLDLHGILDLELAIDPLPPRGSFVHYDFLKLHYIRNTMTHVSPLYVGALTCNVNVNYTTQNYIFRLR